MNCGSVDDDDIKDWESGMGGPCLNKKRFKFDWYGGVKSNWNRTMFLLLAEQIQNAVAEKWKYLPKRELYYYEESIKKKFSNLMTIWRRSQPRKIGAGNNPDDFETEDQVDERVRSYKSNRSHTSRQCTRRHTVSHSPILEKSVNEKIRNTRFVFVSVR